jgi:pseudaminic acid cytidylyltransferase
MKPIVLIPARGGSKRIPRKNIVEISGQSALTILILKLARMNLFEEIVVSTDDDEISQISRSAGASVIKRSSPELSNDVTPSENVVRDFIEVRDLKDSKNSVLCVYPLALLLSDTEITEAINLLRESPEKFVISAGETLINPLRHNFKIEGSNISVLFPENSEKRSQDLEKVFFDVGMFYLAHPKTWMDPEKYWYRNNSRVVVIPQENCIDVDTEDDLIKLKIQYAKTILH